MNIIFLLGNGFDLNLGMATSYCDFHKYYKTVNTQSSLINNLKNEIKINYGNWSNLELELGNYTKELKNENEFTEIYDDLSDRLAEYLEKIENNFDFKQFNGEKLYDYFSYPENSLSQYDREQINTYKGKWLHNQWNVNIISFNYTQTLEKLIGYVTSPIKIGHHGNYPIILYRIEHVHGYYNNRMVMGVNDLSQIANQDFHKKQKVLVDLVKPTCNQAAKHMVDSSCKLLIQSSNLICIFGSSIGDTDKIWWELIGEQLKRGSFLIIFEKGEIIPIRKLHRNALLETEKKNYFLSKTKLTEEEKKNLARNIFIGLNTNIFDLKYDV